MFDFLLCYLFFYQFLNLCVFNLVYYTKIKNQQNFSFPTTRGTRASSCREVVNKFFFLLPPTQNSAQVLHSPSCFPIYSLSLSHTHSYPFVTVKRKKKLSPIHNWKATRETKGGITWADFSEKKNSFSWNREKPLTLHNKNSLFSHLFLRILPYLEAVSVLT